MPAQSNGEGLGNEWSPDGTKLVYASPENVYIETLGGSTWTYEYGSDSSAPFYFR